MTRLGTLQLWVFSVVVLVIGILVLLEMNFKESAIIQQLYSEFIASQQELENVSRLSTALAKLDSLTIDENTATRLEILRHLEMENNDYNIIIGSKSPHSVGAVALTLRDITVMADLSYADALALADKIYNQGKMTITGITLGTAPDSAKADVEIKIDGVIYGLEKHGSQP